MRDLLAEAERARERAAAALACAVAAGLRAERLEQRARVGVGDVRELDEQLARAERRAQERHQVSARLCQSFAERCLARMTDGSAGAAPPGLGVALGEATGLRSAAVSVRESHGVLAAAVATDVVARAAQDLEHVLGEGPGVDVLAGTPSVSVGEAELDERWPRYAAAIRDLGVTSVTAVPLLVGRAPFGSLTAFDAPGQESCADRLTVVAEALAGEILLDPDSLLDEDARSVHVAAGIVAETEGCDVALALDLLRARAFVDGAGLADVAAMVIDDGRLSD